MDNIGSIALSRMVAQQRAIDVTAGNIANSTTAGFQGERVIFSDWLVKQDAAGQPPGGRTVAYAQDRATYRDTRPGPQTQTGNPLDLAIGVDGFFSVQSPRGPRLTRSGHFELSATGSIVDGDGNALLDTAGQPMQVGPTDGTLTVTADGSISSVNGSIGRIGVIRPDDPQKMKAEGSRLFNADGPTKPVAVPRISQGSLEASNVQPTVELNRMMNELREFQFTSQFIQSEADRGQAAIDKIMAKRV